ncbi:enolase C-terminal domain-like protein [Streptomyces sp. NPDC029044]|uniref:enolase C-terminal domain-like protein n=1 Tax=Streptomyces sp. NPDC029044 TaxID=3157198 RepID=UPI0033F14068
MSAICIDRIEVVDVRDDEPAGDDTAFIALHAAGETGWYGPVSAAIASYADKVLAPTVIGADATDHQALLQRLLGPAVASPDPHAPWAMGAIDCAAWDLHGRLDGHPVADLLTPKTARRTVPAYASWLTKELTDSVETDVLSEVLAGSWAFTKWGLRCRSPHSPTEAARTLARAVEHAAEETGVRIAADAVGTWTPSLALTFAERVNPSALIWLEDPLPRHDLRVYGQLAATPVPVAIGERLSLREDPATVLDTIRPVALTLDVVGCGGLTRTLDVLAAARARKVPVYPHGRSLIPGIHLAAAFPQAIPATEYRLQWEPGRQRIYDHAWLPEHGHLRLPESPGLGTTPRRASCREHP